MKHPVPKDARKVVAAALRAGCTLSSGGNNHTKLRSPDGRRTIVMSSHATDPHAAKNIRTDIERMARECGFQL